MRTLTLIMMETLDTGRQVNASVAISEEEYHRYQHSHTEYFGELVRKLGRAIDAEKEKEISPLPLP